MLFAARPHKEEVPLQVECDQYIAGERGTPIMLVIVKVKVKMLYILEQPKQQTINS